MASGYAAPLRISDAVALLARNPGARVLAGGHSLLVEPNRSRIDGALLVDLRRIEGLAGIRRLDGGGLEIGAMTTLSALAAGETVRAAFPVLAEVARLSADAQARNRATIGGALATADPEGDLTAAVIALGGTVQIAGPGGSRTVPADQVPVGAGRTSLGPDEVITSVMIPARVERSGAAYEKFVHPATLGALCGVAAHVALATDGTIGMLCVALTGAAEHPRRLSAVEAALSGKSPQAERIAAAARMAGEGIAFRSDLFASPEYRRHLTHVLAERALRRALGLASA